MHRGTWLENVHVVWADIFCSFTTDIEVSAERPPVRN